jgi:asparagine synthase (glutamine-hydrolysing)
LRSWLHGELAPLVEDVLSPASLTRRKLFDPGAIAKLLEDDRSGRLDAAYPILAIVCIELWCRAFLDAAAYSVNTAPAAVVSSQHR